MPALFEVVRHGLVRREHELLDDAVGDVALAAEDAGHRPGFVEFDHRLGEIEIDRAARVAAGVQQQRQLFHAPELRGERRVALAHLRVAFEHFVDVRVRHALGRANHAGREIGARHLARRVHFHDRAHHQAVHFRIERADAVRKLLRQHGHSAVREIDGRAAQPRFAIERRAPANVVRNVRDVHLQLVVPARQRADVDGVVEIARGLAVDRHNRQIAEIAPSRQIVLGHLLRRRFCVGNHFVREDVRQVMLPDDDLDIDADIARAAENLDHAARRREAALGIARDFDVHHGAIELRKPQAAKRGRLSFGAELLPQFRSQLIARRYRDLVENARVVRQDVVAVRPVAEQADEGRMLVLDNLHHAAFGAPVGAAARDARENVIAVHRIAEIVAADEEIAVNSRHRLLRNQEAVAIAVRDDAAGHQVRVLGSLRRPRGLGAPRRRGGRPARRTALRLLLAREAVFPAVEFLDFAAALELLDDSRQETAAAMFQPHAMRDGPDTRRIGQRRKMRDHLPRADLVRARFLLIDGVLALHRRIRRHRQANGILAEWQKLLATRYSGIGGAVATSRITILPSGSRSSVGAYSPSSSRRHHAPVARFVFISVNQYW